MKLLLRAKAKTLTKKITLISAAFVLAVSTLTASVPFILSQQASAVGGSTVSNITEFDELKDALGNPGVGYINLAPKVTITAREELVLSRSDVRINGNDSVIVLDTTTSAQPGWNGDYVFQVYDATNVEINSLRVRGGDAGFLINGSQVVLKGNTHVDGHEWGGIEVSRGTAAGLRNSQLTLQGALWSEAAPFESATKPSVWLIDGQGTVDSSSLYQSLTAASYVAPGKTYLYRNASLTNSVATNTTQRIAYDNVQTAIDQAANGDEVRLDKNATLAAMVRVTKPLTLDGNNKTLTASYSFTENGVDNAVITVLANSVAIKNLTTTNTSALAKPHGIVAQEVTGLSLSNVTLQNGRAGAIINGSKVTANGIHTAGNSWYGINVDRANAELTISGSNSHAEPVAIKNDDTASAKVIDQGAQYAKYNLDGGAKSYYVLGALKQVGPSDGAVVKGDSVTNSWSTTGNASRYIYESYNNAAGTDLRWREEFTATSKTATNVADGTFYWRVTAVDALGNKTDSTPLWKLTVDSTRPVAPTGLAWTTQSGAVLESGDVTNEEQGVATWNASSSTDVDHYVYRYTNDISGNAYSTTPWEVNVGGTNQPGALNQGEGTHYFSIAAVDKAGNQSAWSDRFAVVLDNTAPIRATILTFTRSLITGNAEPGSTVVVSIDGVDRPSVTAGSDGEWQYPISPALAPGNYGVTVNATDRAGNPAPAENRTFIVIAEQVSQPQAPVAPPATATQASLVVFSGPAAINPAAQQVLGGSDASGSSDTDTSGVEGANTARNVAQAGTNNTDGNAFGLAWYWWLLILAALATIIWWIIAALRRRREEA